MARMTRKRPGYKTLGLDIPEGLYVALEKQAAEMGESVTRLLTLLVADGLKYPRTKLPKRQKAGAKPKEKG